MNPTRPRTCTRTCNMGRPVTRRTPGFTLLELLVAIGLLALVAVMSWRGLDAILRTHDALAHAEGNLDELQRVFQRLEQDALRARDARTIENRLQLSDGTSQVEYRFDAGILTRQVPGVERGGARFEGELASMGVQVWQDRFGWTDGSATTDGTAAGRVAATGVRLSLTLKNGDTASRVFLLGSGI
jgi:prepilin-type N-terminal cleavage/methylation domain-containing protein